VPPHPPHGKFGIEFMEKIEEFMGIGSDEDLTIDLKLRVFGKVERCSLVCT
jgi:hypothetical protein